MMSTTVESPMPGYPRNRLTDRSNADPVVRRTTLSRGYAISYEDAGAGPVILLIPGSTMSAADWRDAGYLDRLVGTHRVISVDPLGNGLSDKPHDPDAYGWPDVAADLVAVLDAAGVERAVAWGYSRGGALAAAVAADFPDRVSGVILHDGAPEPVAKGSAPSANSEAMFRGDMSPIWTAYSFSDDDRRYDEEFNDIQALGAMAIGATRSGVAVNLGQVNAPALVLVGSRDGPDAATRDAEALGAELQILPDLDHLEAFSRLDLVMPAIVAFLRSHGI
jgi:pimeloyl-ACP methyl ester carboxylesterase